MRTRNRSEPHTFEQRLEQQRLRLEVELAGLPRGRQRDLIAARIEQLRAAAEMHELLASAAALTAGFAAGGGAHSAASAAATASLAARASR
jgi:hypothetical protein